MPDSLRGCEKISQRCEAHWRSSSGRCFGVLVAFCYTAPRTSGALAKDTSWESAVHGYQWFRYPCLVPCNRVRVRCDKRWRKTLALVCGTVSTACRVYWGTFGGDCSAAAHINPW